MTHDIGNDRPPAAARAPALWVFSASLIVTCAIWLTGALATLDDAYLDLQSRWLQREHPSDVVIVEIDPRTLKEIGRWPFPRNHHASVIRNLARAGATSIFVDIDFSSASSDEGDRALAAAMNEVAPSTRLLLPAFWQPTSSDASSLLLSEPLPDFRAHAELGLVNLIPGRDGLVREISSFDELSSEIPPVWQLLRAAPQTSDTLTLDYRLSPSSFRRISYVDALHGRDLQLKPDDIVFIGATALELGDMVAVPVYRALPGVVVQALAYESAKEGAPARASAFVTVLALIGWGALCALLLVHGRWRRSPYLASGLLAIAFGCVFACYALLNVLVPVSPFAALTVLTLTGALLSSLSIESLRSWRAMRRSREQDALLSKVVERSSDAILTLSADLLVRTANGMAAEILRFDLQTVIGRSLAKISPALAAAVQAHRTAEILEISLERGNGPTAQVQVSTAELSFNDESVTIVTLRDVTEQRVREAQLRHLALHDSLTGLPNRTALHQQLHDALQKRTDDEIVALLMLDLDGFKEVNDALGHSMGDELMRELGQRLVQLSDASRQIARLGGDEFAVLWRTDSAARIGELAQQLLLIVEEPISIKGIPVSLGTSIGIALCPLHAQDPESLLKRADIALYAAKRRHTRIEFYEPSSDTNSPRRLEMLTSLRAAIAREELFLEYQPKTSMLSGETIEVEALCRWQNATFGRVSPGEFIALAEASDVIKPLTEWTVRRALLDCREWHEQGIDLRVAVNLSARLLQDAKLPQWLEATCASTGSRPEWLEFEITESAIMSDPDRAARVLRSLHEMGVTISIDDFGTGYSSLAYLRTLSVDRLKLDRSFITGMEDRAKDQLIVESTIKLAHGLDLEVVAEGIETERQYELLRSFGCDLGQGYWIARPMPLAQLMSWYRDRHYVPVDVEAAFESTRLRLVR